MGHSLQKNTLRTGQTEVGGSNESGQTDSRGESSEEEETDDEYKSDVLDSEDDSNDVVLAFITSDEEYADEQPATTRSGRAVTRRAEIDFLNLLREDYLKQLSSFQLSWNKLCEI